MIKLLKKWRKRNRAMHRQDPNKAITQKFLDNELKLYSDWNMYCRNTPEGEEGRITAMYHVVEKGLTMPARRMGFGQDMIKALIQTIRNFLQTHGETRALASEACKHALGVLKEYEELHKNVDDSMLNPELRIELKALLKNWPTQTPRTQQITTTATDFFKDIKGDFAAFSASRHCVRNYSPEPVPFSRIEEAVSLANNAPSACNRQPCRVYCIENKEIAESFLNIQGGNRGFGHLADKVLVITAERKIFMPWEVFSLYVNGGIYFMNLSYALHYHSIAHCFLTWVATPEDDQKAKELLNIGDSETIIGAFTVGSAPEEAFAIACSPRKTTLDTLIKI